MAKAGQQSGYPRSCNHFETHLPIDRRKTEGPVMNNLCGDPSLTHHKTRPKRPVPDGPDDDLMAEGLADHRLDGEALNSRVCRLLGQGDEHLLRRRLGLLCAAQSEANAADIRLVGDISRKDLENDGKSDFRRSPRGELWRWGCHDLADGDFE